MKSWYINYKGQYSFLQLWWEVGLINCCSSIFYFIFLSTSIDESAFQSTPCKSNWMIAGIWAYDLSRDDAWWLEWFSSKNGDNWAYVVAIL